MCKRALSGGSRVGGGPGAKVSGIAPAREGKVRVVAGIRLEHLAKEFGSVVAVDDLTLEMRDKEFLVLVGPSGCGKSTILRLIAGLDDPTSGEIYIGDRLVNDVTPKGRDIAMVFQSYALYPHMKVYDNLAFSLKLRSTPKAEIRHRVGAAAVRLGIEDLMDRKPGQLSGGQRQRVALGRAIVREPQVFLMDEPLSNLDAKLRVQTRREIIKLHKALETTFVYVTHDQQEAMTMGTRIAVLRDGVLQQVGSPQAVYRSPVNVFVAGFIGNPAMNFLEGTLVGSPEEMYFDASDFRVKLPGEKAARLAPYVGKDVTFGVRPEHVHDERFSPPEDTSRNFSESLPAEVDEVETLGSEFIVYLLLGQQGFSAKTDDRIDVRSGSHMNVVFDMNHSHFFDRSTEGLTLGESAPSGSRHVSSRGDEE